MTEPSEPTEPTEPTEHDEPSAAQVARAEEIRAELHDPHHDPTTEREAVEGALEDEDLGEAGGRVGDQID